MDISFLSAIIGAGVGLIGIILGTYLGNRIQKKHQENVNRTRIVEKYLYQLAETIYSLKARIINLQHGGRLVMSNEYYLKSSSYALGAVWAYERIFLFDGIYHELDQIEQDAGSNLMNLLKQMMNIHEIHRYHRMALAEILIELKEGHHQVLPYIEYQHRIDEPSFKQALEPMMNWIDQTKNIDPNDKLHPLEHEVARLLNLLGGTDKYVKLAEMEK